MGEKCKLVSVEKSIAAVRETEAAWDTHLTELINLRREYDIKFILITGDLNSRPLDLPDGMLRMPEDDETFSKLVRDGKISWIKNSRALADFAETFNHVLETRSRCMSAERTSSAEAEEIEKLYSGLARQR